MRKKILKTYILILSVTIIVTIFFSWSRVNNHLYAEVKRESEAQINLIEEIFAYEVLSEDFDFQKFASKYGQKINLRITIIDRDGLVFGDTLSDPALMENHKNRTEFKEALKGNDSSNMRFSDTIGQYFFYYAVPLDYDEFSGAIRIAKPAQSIQNILWDMLGSIVFGMLIGVILSTIIAFIFTKRFMTPIDELTTTAKLISSGDYDQKVYIDDDDQIGELAEAFNTMTFTLRKNLWEIGSKNSELEAILTSMDTGLAAIDENYKIILNNEPFQKLLGIEGDIKNKVFYEVTRNPHVFSVIEKSIDEDEYVSEEITLNSGNDQLILSICATPIKGKSDKKTRQGVLIALDNITNLRKLENIRRDFVSNVSHELKTPLTSIKGFVEVLKDGAMNDPKTAERFLDIIDIESDRLTILIEDILSLSEIESMSLDKNTGIYEIAPIVTEIKDMLEVKANKKNLAIIVNIQEDLPTFKCNRDRLKQLFINLVDNSIKYTDVGQVTIECRESRDKEHLVIIVKDTGIGIKEEHHQRLFERFYRIDKGRSRKLGGTGLGLSIVKHIVELYHGTIQVKSKFGQGTTISIRLPFNNE